MADFQSIRFEPQRPLLREISADRLNSILAEIKKNKPLPGRGITLRQTGQGTAIDLATAIKGGGGVAAETHPFQISVSYNAETENYEATVRPGTLNTILPNNIFSGSDLAKFNYPEDAIRYVVLTGTSNGSQFTSCALSVVSSAPGAQTPSLFSVPTEAKYLIGIVRNAQIYQIVKNNIVVTGKQHFVKDKASPAPPGVLPYEIYFLWDAT